MTSPSAGPRWPSVVLGLLGCGLLVTLAAGAGAAVVDFALPRHQPSPLRVGVPVATGVVMVLLCTLAWRQYRDAERRQQSHAEELARLAARLGLTFHAEATPEHLRSFAALLPGIDRKAEPTLRNVIAGEVGDTHLVMADRYPAGMGQEQFETLVLLPRLSRQLPDFTLEPRPRGSDWLGHKGFVFAPEQAAHPSEMDAARRFGEQYYLDGADADEAELRQAFAGDTLRFFADRPGWHLRCKDGVLLLYQDGRGSPAVERPALLQTVQTVADGLTGNPPATAAKPAPAALTGTRLSPQRAALGFVGLLLIAGVAGYVLGLCAGYALGLLAGLADGDPRRRMHDWAAAGGWYGAPALMAVAALLGLLTRGRGPGPDHAGAGVEPPGAGLGPVPTAPEPTVGGVRSLAYWLAGSVLFGVVLALPGAAVVCAAVGILVGGQVADLVLTIAGGPRNPPPWGGPFRTGCLLAGAVVGVLASVAAWFRARRPRAQPQGEAAPSE